MSPLVGVGFALAAQAGPPPSEAPPSVDELRREAKPASRLLGATVKTPRGEKVGRVEDIYMDLDSGRILGVVVSSGGFLGVGDALTVLPAPSLGPGDNGDLRLDTTREQLGAAPRVGRNESGEAAGLRWPALAESSARPDVVVAEGGSGVAVDLDPPVGATPPAERARPTPDADNTGRNRRDREAGQDGAVSPLDQSNARADLQITARLRSALVQREGLSINAKNIKIITRDGEVTLRGPVGSEEERRVIAELAEREAPGRVANQLEVMER